jgi:hypothetical protein
MLKNTAINNLIVIAALSFSSSVSSREISYDYVQGTYLSITDSSLGVDVDGNGFSFSGSFSISPNIAVTALFGAASYDRVAGIDIDATEVDFGITAHTSIAPNTDVLGNFSVVLVDVEVSDGFTTITDDDTGNAISFGLRHMASDTAELNVGFSRVDIFSDTGNTFGFGARFYANNKFSVGVGYSTGDDVDTLLLSARIDLK